jgi:hypothetical protein
MMGRRNLSDIAMVFSHNLECYVQGFSLIIKAHTSLEESNHSFLTVFSGNGPGMEKAMS